MHGLDQNTIVFLALGLAATAITAAGAVEKKAAAQDVPLRTAPLYQERYRPQFHFSSSRNWLNDPNGLVFYKGEYHLFFQHNPKGIKWGNMTWGHAVSSDLVHWTQLDDAIHPDELGTIFSGSAVVDWKNTSGFGTEGQPPLVCIYTSAGKPYTQSIAHSLDGRTFTKYEKNPVLDNIAGGNRDPKVVWHEPTQQWIMILYVKKEQFDLFRSPNLKDWTPLPTLAFAGGHECPDLFPMPLDGDPKEIKWVITSANGAYVVGEFDGNEFVTELGPVGSEFGYAVQTYSDEPQGRRIQIGWLRSGGKPYPGMPFNQQMTVPTALTLRSTPDGPRLFRLPVKELEELRGDVHAWGDNPIVPGENLLRGLTHDLYDIEGEIQAGTSQDVGFNVRGKTVPLHFVDGRAKFRMLVDRITIELFEDDGARSEAMTFMPDDKATPLELVATGGGARIVSLKVYELRPAWSVKGSRTNAAPETVDVGDAGVRQGKPNVLFIAIDDMNDWTTLFDRANPIRTPNLERLAARGMFFTRGYCAAPACNPSRTAILTGLAPATSGCYNNGMRWWKLNPGVLTLPQYFRNSGYLAKGAGKIYHHGGECMGDDPRGTEHSWDSFQDLVETRIPKENYNGYRKGSREVRGLARPAWDWGEHDQKMVDEDMLEKISAIMDEKWDKPMFLAAGIFKPHLPFYAPPEVFRKYPMDDVVLPEMPANDLDDVPDIARKMAHTESFIYSNVIKHEAPDARSLKRMVQCYQASADYSDSVVGRLLDKLDATERADNTIIVLWADHGYHLGDKESCVKFTLWEKANRVPFIIVAPGVTKPGSRCDVPVSLLDIYPTLLDLTGMAPKADNDGYSLVPLLRDPQAEWKHAPIMTMGEGNHAVRTARWRYIRYNDGSEELYDHDNDPWEWKNLAGDKQYAAIIAEHKKLLPEPGKTTAQYTEKGGS